MTKAQILARYKDECNHSTRLYEELQQRNKELNQLAEWAGSILNVAYSLGITQEQLSKAMKNQNVA